VKSVKKHATLIKKSPFDNTLIFHNVNCKFLPIMKSTKWAQILEMVAPPELLCFVTKSAGVATKP